MAEIHDQYAVLTLDSDFMVYRKGREPLALLFPRRNSTVHSNYGRTALDAEHAWVTSATRLTKAKPILFYSARRDGCDGRSI
jgi:hypothetical protein